MKLIAGLGAVAQGAGLGLADMRQEEDRQRRIKNEETDRAYLDEQRTQQRTQWERSNEDADRQKRIRELTSKIVNSEYQPEEIELGVDADGNPAKGYKMGGQLFQSLQDPKAQDLLAELKSPLGQARRIAEAHMAEGDYQGAASILANATKLKADSFSLAEIERKAKYQKQQDQMFDEVRGADGSNPWENAGKLMTRTQLFGLAGKTVKPEFTTDGKYVVFGVYDQGGLDGKETKVNQLQRYENTPAGLMRMYADLRQGSPEQMAAWAKENEERDLKLKKEGREQAESEAKIGLSNAHADYYKSRPAADQAAATRTNAAEAAAQNRAFTAALMKPSLETISLPDLSGKAIASTSLKSTYQQLMLAARQNGMGTDEAIAHATQGIADLKETAAEAIQLYEEKNRGKKVPPLTMEQAIAKLTGGYGGRGATSATNATAAAAAKPSSGQTQEQPQRNSAGGGNVGLEVDPLEQMNIATLRRIAAIQGHVNQKAAAARLAKIDAESAANLERQMQENPQGFGLAMP